MRVHMCLLDRECRGCGPLWRIHFDMPRRHIGIALRPRDRFVRGKPRWVYIVKRARID